MAMTAGIDASTYQKLAARTIPDADTGAYIITDDDVQVLWAAVGLAGEAGETLDEIKKAIFHRHGIDLIKLSKELGDVLWYVVMLCTVTGLDVSAVMQENIDKLHARYPDGFDPSSSIKRIDVQP